VEPRAGSVALRRRIGYLPGDFVLDGQQSVREMLIFSGNLRGGVSRERINTLAERLDIDPATRIRSLSKGNRQKAGLIQAFMHEPELLILDEPTSGLDPLVQHTFLQLVREARTNGQTVFMSSHVLSEVEQIADRAGIVREGRLVAVEQVESLRAHVLPLVEIRFEAPVPADAFSSLPGVKDLAIDGPLLRCRLGDSADALVKAAARFTVLSIRTSEPSLEELFFAYYRNDEADHDA
jgi:ABC-2 type transport system ATP-binding protein